MKRTALVAAAFLMGAALTACGDDGGSSGSAGGTSYCDLLKDARASVDTIDFTALNEATYADITSQFNELEEAAPAEIQDDWATLNDFLTQFKQIFDDAGLSLDDLEKVQNGELPEGIDLQAVQEIGTKVQALSADGKFEEASAAVKDNAKSECNIDLDETTSPSSGS